MRWANIKAECSLQQTKEPFLRWISAAFYHISGLTTFESHLSLDIFALICKEKQRAKPQKREVCFLLRVGEETCLKSEGLRYLVCAKPSSRGNCSLTVKKCFLNKGGFILFARHSFKGACFLLQHSLHGF